MGDSLECDEMILRCERCGWHTDIEGYCEECHHKTDNQWV